MAKVVHLTSVHAATDTRILYRECATLAAAGHDVVLVIAADEQAVQGLDTNGVRLLCVPRPKGRIERMTHTARAVMRAALLLDADLYHLHDPELLPWAFALRLRGKKYVYDMHEYVPGAITDKAWIPAPLRHPMAALARLGERLLLQGVPVIFAEDSYHKHYQWVQQWTTVRNFPNLALLAGYRASPAPRFTVGYVGGVGTARGSETMLRAVHLLQQQGVNVVFQCIGPASPAHLQSLQDLIASLGLQDVHLHGRMSPPAALPIIAQCHVGLAVLQNKPNYFESYPTKMFEYMALGLPVVVSDFPLYRAIVDGAQCGICVAPDDPAALAAALRTLHDDLALACQMGANGRQAVETTYNWENEATKLVQIYEELFV